MSDNESSKPPAVDRRDFIKLGGAATAGFLARGVVTPPAHAFPPLPSNPVTPAAMPTRNLGHTGYQVGIFSLGGQAAVEQPNNEAIAVPIVERALDLGINYIGACCGAVAMRIREMARGLGKLPEDSRMWKKGGRKLMSAHEYYDHDKLEARSNR